MIKTLLALSTACASQIIAEQPANDYTSSSCCEPAQKKCIDCECYTPQYYNLQCACDYFIFADFLYWYGKETGLSYALKGESIPTTSNFDFPAPREVKWMEESWDPGVRIGIGSNDFCDGWDLSLYWTYFHTEKKQSTSLGEPATEFLFNPWSGLSFFLDLVAEETDVLSSTASAKWDLSYNTFDIELGRNYWLSPSFSMRPYMGIRGGWTDTNFSDKSFGTVVDDLGVTDTFFDDIKFKNKFWGVGFSGGFQPNWHLGCGFSIIGNADMALLWGRFDINRTELLVFGSDDPSERAEINAGKSKSDFSAMQAILDLGAGLRYESTYCCDRYRLALDLGWEHHIWFDHNHRIQYTAGLSLPSNEAIVLLDSYNETYGNLVFGGLVVRARFDF